MGCIVNNHCQTEEFSFVVNHNQTEEEFRSKNLIVKSSNMVFFDKKSRSLMIKNIYKTENKKYFDITALSGEEWLLNNPIKSIFDVKSNLKNEDEAEEDKKNYAILYFLLYNPIEDRHRQVVYNIITMILNDFKEYFSLYKRKQFKVCLLIYGQDEVREEFFDFIGEMTLIRKIVLLKSYIPQLVNGIKGKYQCFNYLYNIYQREDVNEVQNQFVFMFLNGCLNDEYNEYDNEDNEIELVIREIGMVLNLICIEHEDEEFISNLNQIINYDCIVIK